MRRTVNRTTYSLFNAPSFIYFASLCIEIFKIKGLGGSRCCLCAWWGSPLPLRVDPFKALVSSASTESPLQCKQAIQKPVVMTPEDRHGRRRGFGHAPRPPPSRLSHHSDNGNPMRHTCMFIFGHKTKLLETSRVRCATAMLSYSTRSDEQSSRSLECFH